MLVSRKCSRNLSWTVCVLVFSVVEMYYLYLVTTQHKNNQENNNVATAGCSLNAASFREIYENISQVQIVHIKRDPANSICLPKQPIENLKLFRDLNTQERRGSRDHVDISSYRHPDEFDHWSSEQFPGQYPGTAHVVWCGEKTFTFTDYLSVLRYRL